MPGVTVEQAQLFTDPARAEVDMVFQFEHVGLDQGASKWDVRPLRLRDLKASFGRWQAGLADVGWNSLYWDNHDQPRAVSRFGDDRPQFRRDSATCLATLLHLHRGTPYVYQGEELGMTNYPFAAIDDFRDIESVNHFATAMVAGEDPAHVLAALRRMSRDNARTPVQWDAHRARRLHHRDAVAAGEPRPRRVERRRPAGRPHLGARALPAADRAAARRTRWSRSATSRCCCPTTSEVYAFTRTLDGERAARRLQREPDAVAAGRAAAGGRRRRARAGQPAGRRADTCAPWEARVLQLS